MGPLRARLDSCPRCFCPLSLLQHAGRMRRGSPGACNSSTPVSPVSPVSPSPVHGSPGSVPSRLPPTLPTRPPQATRPPSSKPTSLVSLSLVRPHACAYQDAQLPHGPLQSQTAGVMASQATLWRTRPASCRCISLTALPGPGASPQFFFQGCYLGVRPPTCLVPPSPPLPASSDLGLMRMKKHLRHRSRVGSR